MKVIENYERYGHCWKRMENMKMLKMSPDGKWQVGSIKKEAKSKETTIADSSDQEAERSQREPGS